MTDDPGATPLPSLKALRVFETVSRTLNFRLAADELGVTQAAVAQQVRALEASLGLKLFERRPRGLAATENGRAYGLAIGRAFELIADATAALRPAGRHVTISVTPTIAAKWLIPRLSRFTARHPDIDVRVLASERNAAFPADAVDLAIRYGRPPFGPGLSAELLLDNEIVAVASPRLLKETPPLSARALARYPLIHDAHDAWPTFLGQDGARASKAPGKSLRFNQTALAVDAAVAGQGLALAGRFFVDAEIAAGRLVQVSPKVLRPGLDYYMVSPHHGRRDAAVAEVRAWLLDEAEPG